MNSFTNSRRLCLSPSNLLPLPQHPPSTNAAAWPADDRVDPPTPPQTQPANIPAQVFQEAYERLVNNIRPEYDDSRIQRSLKYVWLAIQDVLEKDPKLKGHLADKNEFLVNVKRKGEQEFIKSPRDMIWQRLTPGSVYLTTVHCSLPSTLSTLILFSI
jgi:hypothetical protein